MLEVRGRNGVMAETSLEKLVATIEGQEERSAGQILYVGWAISDDHIP
jgi:hypothetical protein